MYFRSYLSDQSTNCPILDRYPSQILTQVLEVCLFLTIAASIMLTKYDSLSKRRLVSTSFLLCAPQPELTVIAECKLIFLPPYSPDYNPIEQTFSCIKAWLRRNQFDKSLTSLSRACQHITPEMAAGFFWSSGYI